MPVLTPDQYEDTYLLSIALGWSSFILCLVGLTTLLAVPRNRAWPRRLFIYPMIAGLGLSLAFVGNSMLSLDQVLCDADGFTPKSTGWCKIQGVAIIIFANALCFWLTVLSFHFFSIVAGFRPSRDRCWRCCQSGGDDNDNNDDNDDDLHHGDFENDFSKLSRARNSVMSERTSSFVEPIYQLFGWGPGVAAGICAAALDLTGAAFGSPFCFFNWYVPPHVLWIYFFGPYCLTTLCATMFLVAALLSLRREGSSFSTYEIRLCVFLGMFWLFGTAVITCWLVLSLNSPQTPVTFNSYLECIDAGNLNCQPPSWSIVLVYLNAIATAWPGTWLFLLFATTKRNLLLWKGIICFDCFRRQPTFTEPEQARLLSAEPLNHDSINWSHKSDDAGSLSDLGYFTYSPDYSSGTD